MLCFLILRKLHWFPRKSLHFKCCFFNPQLLFSFSLVVKNKRMLTFKFTYTHCVSFDCQWFLKLIIFLIMNFYFFLCWRVSGCVVSLINVSFSLIVYLWKLKENDCMYIRKFSCIYIQFCYVVPLVMGTNL